MELKKRMDVNSDFVAKNNIKNFLTIPLHMFLKDTHGDRPSSRCQSTTEVVSDVKIMEMACAWSKRGASYFVSTCGNAEIHEDKHVANFEADFVNVIYEEINRLSACPTLCEVLPFVDEHNRMRQKKLGLEKNWLTKDWCFLLLTNSSGLTAVDMHWWHRINELEVTSIDLMQRRQNEIKIFII